MQGARFLLVFLFVHPLAQAEKNQASQKSLMDCVAKFHRQSVVGLSTPHAMLNEADPTQPILLVPQPQKDAKGMMVSFRVYTPTNAFQYTVPTPTAETEHADFRDRKNHIQFRIEDPNLSVTQNGRQSFFISTYEQRKPNGAMISTDIDTANSNATTPLFKEAVHRVAMGGGSDMSSESTEALRDFLLHSFTEKVESAGKEVTRVLADEKKKNTPKDILEYQRKASLEELHNWRASLPVCLETGDPTLTASIKTMMDSLKSSELRLTHKIETNPRSLRDVNSSRFHAQSE